jgi:5'-deoxynucleotidase YfbR-like HD superfamily hydrolase
MTYNFFATLSRMKYIERWALMRNAREETLSEHTLDVAMIAHALCVIGNKRFGKSLNADRAALIGLYHDASEIITGDMPTPVKYYNDDLRDAYKEVERAAEQRLLKQLPEDLQDVYGEIFEGDSSEEASYMRRLMKAYNGYADADLRAPDYWINNDTSIEAYAGDVANRIVQYCKDRGVPQVDVVAHSMGGLVVREILRAHPEASGKILAPLIISLAMMEALTIYGLVIAFVIAGKI